MATATPAKSKLVAMGALLTLLAFTVVAPFDEYLERRFRLTLPLCLFIDATKTMVLWGPGLMLMGFLRDRRAKKRAGE
jgi:hypothetical protein